jgi:hypothetical protein
MVLRFRPPSVAGFRLCGILRRNFLCRTASLRPANPSTISQMVHRIHRKPHTGKE